MPATSNAPETDAPPPTDAGGLAHAELVAVVLVVIGMSLAALNGALMKLLSSDMSPFMVVWARYLGFFLVMLPIALFRAGSGILSPARPVLQIGRALTIAGGTVCFVAGVRTMAYADAIAILYIYPFLLTAMAPIFLGERVPRAAWLGVTGGFAGVLLVMRPDFANIDGSALLVLACGVLVACHLIFNRKLGPIADPVVTSMWGAFIAMLALSVTLPFAWQMPTWPQLQIFLAIAVVSALGQSTVLFAFARAPASTLAPFTYTEIVSAIGYGWLIFGTVPGATSWAGIALIVTSGLIVARAPRLGTKVTRRRHPAV